MTATLLAQLLPLLLEYTPQLIHDGVDLIHGNPQQPGETDEAYIQRVYASIDADVAQIEQQDADIQKAD